MRGFAGYHPSILFIWYIGAVLFVMAGIRPVSAVCAFFGAALFAAATEDAKVFFADLVFYLQVVLLFALINSLISHNGETMLFFVNDMAVTKEAILYGLASAGSLTAVLWWSILASRFLTTDKFLYLFGKLIPKIALILTMVFRFLPLFKEQTERIRSARQAMGLAGAGKAPARAAGEIRVFDALIGWSLENSIDTADAMKARGYGLSGRTSFSLFRFGRRDGVLLGIVLAASAWVLFGYLSGAFDFVWYPLIVPPSPGWRSAVADGFLALFYAVPFAAEMKERIAWRLSASNI